MLGRRPRLAGLRDFDPLADGVVGSPRSGSNCAREEPAAHTDPTVNAPAINGERDLGEGAVGEFHRVALAPGFRDNGPPGERRYHPGYYGAFLLALDGNNIEASMAACRRAG
jgi:hypothetical protein